MAKKNEAPKTAPKPTSTKAPQAETKAVATQEQVQAITGPAAGYFMMKASPKEISEVMDANLGGQALSAFDLDRIKIPAGGITQWQVQTLEGEELVKVFEGIILHWQDVRAYWNTSYEQSGGGTPPNCSSMDSITGRSDGTVNGIGGPCANCPMSQFGTAEKNGERGKGQACKQMRMLFVARPNKVLPEVIMLPPTSIKPARKYFQRLSSHVTEETPFGVPYYGVVTQFKLEKAKNSDGVEYGQASLASCGTLTKEQREKVKATGDQFRPQFKKVDLNQGDFEGGNSQTIDAR